ncbi:MAG: YebC/PmpR family DNA-binding transcriptional regulator [Alphaproteobacteria bacterium]|nr:YebC/PmpR family DNA-binding transcriptional regulator [Alphaproteobacteria bacterium]
MAGHSKWANIQHRKGAQDKKRSKLFSKLAKEITVAAKMGAPDVDMNPRLRLAVNTAKQNSLPKDVITRAIKKSSDADTASYDEMRYEGFAAGGVGIIVEALTDNRNRTASSVRSIFTKAGCNMGADGSVSFGFDRVGCISYAADVADEDTMMEAVIESGADDCESSDDGHDIYCDTGDLHTVAKALEGQFGEPKSANMIWKAQIMIDLDDESGEKVYNLISSLEDDDDVQEVYSNLELTDSLMERIAAG